MKKLKGKHKRYVPRLPTRDGRADPQLPGFVQLSTVAVGTLCMTEAETPIVVRGTASKVGLRRVDVVRRIDRPNEVEFTTEILTTEMVRVMKKGVR